MEATKDQNFSGMCHPPHPSPLFCPPVLVTFLLVSSQTTVLNGSTAFRNSTIAAVELLVRDSGAWWDGSAGRGTQGKPDAPSLTPENPHGRREPTPPGCALTATFGPWHAHTYHIFTHAHRYTHNKERKKM